MIKSLHKDFKERVKGTDNLVMSMEKPCHGQIEHTAVTVFTRRNESGAVDLLAVTKYVWLQSETDDYVPGLCDMLSSEIVLIGEEVRLFEVVVKKLKYN